MISSETLRQLRTLKGIKQEILAKGLGISQPAYCKLEHNICIDGERLKQILIILKCSMEELEEWKKTFISSGVIK